MIPECWRNIFSRSIIFLTFLLDYLIKETIVWNVKLPEAADGSRAGTPLPDDRRPPSLPENREGLKDFRRERIVPETTFSKEAKK
jgi:hypothetical protein